MPYSPWSRNTALVGRTGDPVSVSRRPDRRRFVESHLLAQPAAVDECDPLTLPHRTTSPENEAEESDKEGV